MKVSLLFRDAEGKSDSGGLPLWNSGEAGGWALLFALPIEGRAHNWLLSALSFDPGNECYTVLIL